MELVCPAGSLPALKAAVDNGADAVYIGFRDDTNARHFAGLNFNDKKAQKALDYARNKGVKLFVAINTYPQASGWQRWTDAVDMAASLQADAVIAADLGILDYSTNKHPNLNRHLSVQGSATNEKALQFYADNYGIKRAVLPRVLSMTQVEALTKTSPVELETFAFGSLCIMAEGRCHLSSYVTGESPNMSGVCSPAKAVRWQETDRGRESRLNNVLIDRFGDNENAGYPTLCKGRFEIIDQTFNALEEPISLNTLQLLPRLQKAGIKALKIEGRQRSPSYVAQVTRVWREALDALPKEQDNFAPRKEWMNSLQEISEGSQTTLGAYSRPWQ